MISRIQCMLHSDCYLFFGTSYQSLVLFTVRCLYSIMVRTVYAGFTVKTRNNKMGKSKLCHYTNLKPNRNSLISNNNINIFNPNLYT